MNLFNVISNNIYKPVAFNKPCEELCLDVLNIILERNESTLPIDHTVLSVSSLYMFEEGKYFTGKFGQKSELSPESAQIGGRLTIGPFSSAIVLVYAFQSESQYKGGNKLLQ